MKGSSQGIPSYLYVLVALIVGIMMLTMIFRYSDVFIEEKTNITIGGDEKSISKDLARIIQECWEDNRRGLEDKSSICKEINFKESLKVEEKNVTEYLDCEKLPNTNCYLYPETLSDYDCSECSSDYFGDTDKLIWLAEKQNKGIKINYFGGSRKIVVVGSPCDGRCMCERDCKQRCIDGLTKSDCEKCYDYCENIIIITTTTTTITTIPTCDANGGYLHTGLCWYLGGVGQSCDDVCESHGSTCVNSNWNDDNDCHVCEHLTGDTRCREDEVVCDNDGRPRPGQTLIGNPLTEGCHVRRSSCPQVCSASDPDHRRICVCTF